VARTRQKQPAKPVLYLVERCGMEEDWYNDLATLRPEPQRDWVPVVAFTDRRKAEAACAELERKARTSTSPFLFSYLGELEPISDRSEEDWLARVRDVVGRPPTQEKYPCKYGGIDWHAWWKAEAGELSDEQRLALWDLCDLRLYRVSEVPAE
jgi:hypothetical protein